ncbi:MAG TPA: sigma-70 family RNA polymerase sigma factor, partial [Pinirhizobacter sp.]|uniref:sigma-70 family RNA polymerase sigma factor n=1 Tax=Pinirhizobacter sp. TaxID=2950432 RepID=UPI002C01A2C3
SVASIEAVRENNQESDADCMRRYQSGDTSGFEVLYLRYRHRLHRYVLRLAGRPSEAEEVFQEVWAAVVKARATWTPDASFTAWLFGIAHRRAADRWRSLGRHSPDAHEGTDDGLESLADAEAPDASGPERHAHNLTLQSALLAAVLDLPLPQREAFLLKAEGDLSVEEIAAATGVPRETAKSRLRYAQSRLRQALEVWR